MIPVAEARLFVLSACKVLTPVQMDVGGAYGHVLAETVLATADVPPFANSSMDGYALRAADTASPPVRLRVVASVMAGSGKIRREEWPAILRRHPGILPVDGMPGIV